MIGGARNMSSTALAAAKLGRAAETIVLVTERSAGDAAVGEQLDDHQRCVDGPPDRGDFRSSGMVIPLGSAR